MPRHSKTQLLNDARHQPITLIFFFQTTVAESTNETQPQRWKTETKPTPRGTSVNLRIRSTVLRRSTSQLKVLVNYTTVLFVMKQIIFALNIKKLFTTFIIIYSVSVIQFPPVYCFIEICYVILLHFNLLKFIENILRVYLLELLLHALKISHKSQSIQ